MLKVNEIQEIGIQKLQECLSLIPSISINTITKLQDDDIEPDYYVEVQGSRSKFDQVIYVIVKSLGTPKSTRNAVNGLLRYLQNHPSAYGIFIAPFISQRSASICDQAGIGYLDLSGNCRIAFQQVFISRENFPNKFPTTASLSSLYSPKSERVLRVLLTFPYRPWKTIELANKAQVSPGMITHIRKKLEAEELSETTPEGLRLVEPEKLLQAWTEHSSLQRNQRFDYYSLKPISELEKVLAEMCNTMNIPYALTGFSAANRLAPMVRSQRLMAYIDGQEIDLLATRLGLKPVTSGANVLLYKPYDAGVLWNSQIADGISIATPIQVYLDLSNIRGRGDEAAEFLYKEVIQKQWQQTKTNTAKS